jgi:hypothetical protein
MTRLSNVPVLVPRPTIRFPVAPRGINQQLVESIIKDTLDAANRPHGPAFIARIIGSWVDAGCHVQKWESKNPEMAYALGKRLEDWRVRMVFREDGRRGPLLLGAFPFREENPLERANTDRRFALDEFAVFLIAAAPRAEIGRCDRCGRFYWNRWGHTNKRFCARQCSQRQTAIEGQAKMASRQRQEKNRRIRATLKALIDTKPRTADWRAWVAERARVSKNYLTRALRRGDQGKAEGIRLSRRQRVWLSQHTESLRERREG